MHLQLSHYFMKCLKGEVTESKDWFCLHFQVTVMMDHSSGYLLNLKKSRRKCNLLFLSPVIKRNQIISSFHGKSLPRMLDLIVLLRKFHWRQFNCNAFFAYIAIKGQTLFKIHSKLAPYLQCVIHGCAVGVHTPSFLSIFLRTALPLPLWPTILALPAQTSTTSILHVKLKPSDLMLFQGLFH